VIGRPSADTFRTAGRAVCAGGALVAALLAAGGCVSGGRIELASLDFRNIDPPAPHVVTLRVADCCWWTDARGDLWIAMHRAQHVPLRPRLRFELDLSLRLADPPAGRARNYKLDRDSLRMRVGIGPWQLRFSSIVGIAAVYRERGNRLRGSVRTHATRVTSQLLGGWGKPSGYLLMASYTARHDERRGREIARRTEADGWQRKPPHAPRRRRKPPASQPGAAGVAASGGVVLRSGGGGT